VPFVIRSLVLKGSLNVSEFRNLLMLTNVTTLIAYHVPRRHFRRFRWLWVFFMLEYWGRHAGEFINNRNQLDSIYDNNFVMIWAMLYLETNNMLTAAILEGVLYGELSLWNLPHTIYNSTENYVFAMPVILLAQSAFFGGQIGFHCPLSLEGLWYHKGHITGWTQLNHTNELHRPVFIVITVLFMIGNAKNSYDLLCSMEKAYQEDQLAIKTSESTP